MSLELETIFAQQVQASMVEVIDRLVSEVGRRISMLEIKPIVHVTTPPVTVPKPTVNMAAPNIEVAAPNVDVEVSMEEVCAHLANIETLLLRMIEVSQRSTVREVTSRDSEGRIKMIEDRRG